MFGVRITDQVALTGIPRRNVSPPPTTLPSVGEIARRLDEPVHRIEYVIRSRDIRPKSWAGSCRVFREDDVTYIASELRRIDEDREPVHG